VFVQLAHEESKQKSERIKAAWDRRFRQVREGRRDLLTAWMPAWVQAKDGELVLIPERAETVRIIFALARQGLGPKRIAQKLRKDKMTPFGPSKNWSTEYIRRVLADRRAVGELQPKTGKDRQPNGDKLTTYYPAVVSLDEYLDARAATNGRMRKKAGRIGKGVANLFSGLLVNARDGQSYRIACRTDTGKPERVLSAASFVDGKGPCYSFPFAVFERSVLQGLKEIDPKTILPQAAADDRVTALEIELTTVRNRLTEYNAELDAAERGAIKSVARKLAQLEGREHELIVALDQAREEAVKPLESSFYDVQTLTDLLDQAESEELIDLRTRLKNAIRRTIREVQVLVVRRGRTQLAAIQLYFHAGETPNDHRDYLLVHKPGRGNQHGRTEASSWWRSLAFIADPSELDLRRCEDAAALERDLLKVDVTWLAEQLGGG
jgi:hypothetical protein